MPRTGAAMTRISAAKFRTTGASLAEVLMIAPRRKRDASRNRRADAVMTLPSRGEQATHGCVKPIRFYPAGIDVATG